MLTWIARFTGALALGLATVMAASAQETGTITGTVVDGSNLEPMTGAQVHIPGTEIGALTNDAGRYVLQSVPAGEVTVRVQVLGYAVAEQTVTVTAEESVVADFELSQEAIALDQLVVTALGIERTERGLGYAVQDVTSERLAEVPTINVVQALKGQAAGMDINTASSRPGAANRVVIRGESSFTGGGQPLWVIDGVPIRMDTDEQSGLDDTFELEVGQAGDRGMDLDPNMIESISVLRGAAATALYGSRAAHGVIVVTTKKGEPGASTRFTISSRIEMSEPLLYGKQTNYTAGDVDENGVARFCNALSAEQGGWCENGYPGESPTDYLNWGPHRDSLSADVLAHEGSVRLVDPRSDYFRNGQLSETSISASGGISGGGNYNLGVTYSSDSGIGPGTELDRLNLSANVTLQLTDRLQAGTMVMFANSVNQWRDEGYEGASRELVLNFPANRDIRDAWICGGEPVREDTCGEKNPVMFGGDSPHFDWVAENEYRNSNTVRWIASQTLRYDILPNLWIQNRLGMDTYNDRRNQLEAERPWRTADGETSGGALQGRERRLELNNDLILNLAGTPVGGGVTLSGLLGANVNINEDDDLMGLGEEITIPGFYNIDNFEDQRIDETLTQQQRLVGVYGQVTADYRDWAFLTLTGRNDWSSTLPPENNDYFYPSASLGIVFTDALGWQSPWLQYGKVRASVAKVGSDAPPYRLVTTYDQADVDGVSWPYKDQFGYQQDNVLANSVLKPESTTEYEFGIDLRGLDGRARLDVSYYDKRSYDQIFDVPASPTTGYDEITRNAGELRNEGVEVSLQTIPIQTSNFRWDLQFNWSRNRSTVLELAPGVESIPLAGYSWPQVRIMAGEPYGVIWGYGYARDENGNRLIYGPSAAEDGDARSPVSGEPTTPGFPIFDDELQIVGNSQPDWTGSMYSAFGLGPFNLAALFTARQGGDILNFDLNYTVGNGSAAITGVRNDEYVYEGVDADTGEPNDQVVIRNKEFWQDLGAYNHHENFIEDGSFVRLQSLSLSYTLPQSLVSRIGLTSLQLYAQGNNLKIWTDYSYGDPQGSNYGSTNAGGSAFHFFLPPPARRFSIGLRADF